MNEPNWLEQKEVLLFHDELLSRFGGGSGIRDQNKFESAMNRPLNPYHYEEANIFTLAATYANGIVKSHPFIDGNKRTGLFCAAYFLELNGYELIASEEQAVLIILDLAQSLIGVSELSKWLEDNVEEVV